MSNPLRIAFMGTPDFVVPALSILNDDPDFDVVCVYTQPPRPKGRGKHLQNTPVHDAALKKNIEVRTPLNFKSQEDVQDFQSLNIDAAVVAAYGLMLPDDILNAPKHGCINIHPSLLPRWRGVSPIQFALWKGDTQTGITVMKLVQKMDAGPILAQHTVPIASDGTAQELSDTLWPIGNDLLLQVLKNLKETGSLEPQEQDEDGATFCHMLTKDHGRIDWSQTAPEIDRHIRALNPWPGTWSVLPNGKRLKILKAQVEHTKAQEAPGTIIFDDGVIQCGSQTTLRLMTLQPEGKKPMDIASAVNGGYLKTGDRLS